MSAAAWAVEPMTPDTSEHMDLVHLVARSVLKRLPYGIEYDDLVQEGSVGLLDAARRHDGSAAFRTFAEHRIRGAMLDYLRSLDPNSRGTRAWQKRIAAARRDGVTAAEAADQIGITLDELHRRESAVVEEVSLIGPDGEPLEFGVCADPGEVSDYERLASRVEAAVASLPDAERAAVSLVFFSELTQDAVSIILGVTKSRVCQIMESALCRLEKRLSE